MAPLLPRSLSRYRPYIGLASFCCVLFILTSYVYHQVTFENFLNLSAVTFESLGPPSYKEAVIDACTKREPIKYDNALLPKVTNEDDVIPQIIHFIWFRDLYTKILDRPDHATDFPHSGSDSPEVCKNFNPDWDVRVWNTSAARELLETHYPWSLKLYDSYPHPIQRVDAFKYFALYHYGGFYLDLDVTCRRSLEPLRRFPAWWPKATWQGVNNDVFAVRKHHGAVEYMTKQLKGRNYRLFFPYLTVYWTTGPKYVTDMLQAWQSNRSQRLMNKKELDRPGQDVDDFWVLPLPFYSEEWSFFGHKIGGSWHGPDVAVILWLVDRPWMIAVLGGVLIFALLSLYRVYRRRRSRQLIVTNRD